MSVVLPLHTSGGFLSPGLCGGHLPGILVGILSRRSVTGVGFGLRPHLPLVRERLCPAQRRRPRRDAAQACQGLESRLRPAGVLDSALSACPSFPGSRPLSGSGADGPNRVLWFPRQQG